MRGLYFFARSVFTEPCLNLFMGKIVTNMGKPGVFDPDTINGRHRLRKTEMGGVFPEPERADDQVFNSGQQTE